MANATAKVQMGTVPWGEDKIRRPVATTATTFYSGAMLALDASGNLNHCGDNTGLKFDGILCDADDSGHPVAAGDATHYLLVERPWRFSMAIAAAVAGDEGKAVYAVDDQTVGYSTSHSILVGWVDQVLSATAVLIRPAWAGVNGTANFDANSLVFTGATTVNNITIPDNLADALSIYEGSNEYLTFVTTDAAEAIEAKKMFHVTSAAATAFAVGRLGATTPGLLVDASTATSITGFSIKTAAAGNGLALAAIGETNVNTTLDAKGSGTFSINTVATGAIVLGRATTGVSLAVTAGLTSSGATGAGIGYATGAGGAVSQLTDRTTTVVLSKLAGQITTQATSLAAAALVSFTVTNTTVAIGDTVLVAIQSGPTTVGTTAYVTAVAAGSFQITLKNLHASTADTGAAIINFSVIKSVAA